MAIAEMQKLRLVAMAYDRDNVLDALHRTGAAEIRLHTETENTRPLCSDAEELSSYLSSVEAALSVLCKEIEDEYKERKIKSDVLKDGFDVTYSEFVLAKDGAKDADETVAKINALVDERNVLKNELAKLRKEITTAEIYAALQMPFSAFGDTQKTRGKLGVVQTPQLENCFAKLAGNELCAAETLGATANETLLFVACYKSVAAEVDGVLSSFGFTLCPYTDDRTGAALYQELVGKERELQEKLKRTADAPIEDIRRLFGV